MLRRSAIRWFTAAALGYACAGALPARGDPGSFKDPIVTAATPYKNAEASRLNAIVRAGERLVAVGPQGRIVVSADAGSTWKQSPVPVSSDLVSVRFVTPTTGWAVGHDGVVVRTVDGGDTWSKQLDGRDAALVMKERYVDRASTDDAASKKLSSEIARVVSEGADKPFFDVLFVDENEGFIVGAFNMAFRTEDGGRTWQPLYDRTDNPERLHIYSLAAAGGQVYAAGERGLVMRWDRAEKRFRAIPSPYAGSFFGSLASRSLIFVFGMRGSIYASPDGGEGWSKLHTAFTSGVTSATALPDGNFVFVTQGGQVAVTTDEGRTLRSAKVSRPGSFNGVAAVDHERVALVGPWGVQLEKIR